MFPTMLFSYRKAMTDTGLGYSSVWLYEVFLPLTNDILFGEAHTT
jgi:hypothetical protein